MALKLHLGCGNRLIEGFINIDIRPETNCQIIDDISKLNNFNKESVDLIYVCHVLEHFERNKYVNVLQRWYCS